MNNINVLHIIDAAIHDRAAAAEMVATARGMVADDRMEECDRRLSLLNGPKEARRLHNAYCAVAQLIADNKVALATLENDGQGDSPLAGFLRAALLRVGASA